MGRLSFESSNHDDMCWICLEDKDDNQELVSPCKCPRKVHPKCLARWQLQQAGRAEETQCRFCNSTLADWKQSLTPSSLQSEVKNVQPVMVVYFEGQIHRIPVAQGPGGLDEFTQRIRDLFRLPSDVDISLTFGCKEPMSGQHIRLEGMGAFDAAVHCASVAAAERQAKLKSNSTNSMMTRQKSPVTGPLHETDSSTLSPALGAATPLPPTISSSTPAGRNVMLSRRTQSMLAPRDHPHTATDGELPVPAIGLRPVAIAEHVEELEHAHSTRGHLHSFSARRCRNANSSGLPAASEARTVPGIPPSPSTSDDGSRLHRSSTAGAQQTARWEVPASDDTVAVGTLTGRFKMTLKAFSRKVSRTFSVSNTR